RACQRRASRARTQRLSSVGPATAQGVPSPWRHEGCGTRHEPDDVQGPDHVSARPQRCWQDDADLDADRNDCAYCWRRFVPWHVVRTGHGRDSRIAGHLLPARRAVRGSDCGGAPASLRPDQGVLERRAEDCRGDADPRGGSDGEAPCDVGRAVWRDEAQAVSGDLASRRQLAGVLGRAHVWHGPVLSPQ
ncbi:Abc transporter a family member 1, partial [Globisporangium polare]